jgi:hypothetical protein
LTAGGRRENPRAHFDDRLFEADLRRVPEVGRDALRSARARFEQDGVSATDRRLCQAEHPSGTQLPGCLKVYIPDFGGPWRIVQITRFADDALGLEYVAAGLGHPPAAGVRRSVLMPTVHRWPVVTLTDESID